MTNPETVTRTKTICSITLELLFIGFSGILLLWASNTFIFENPSRPQFRLIASFIFLLVLSIFLLIKKPSLQELGLDFNAINRKWRKWYYTGFASVIIFFVTSYLFEPNLFSLMQNVRFGIVAPIFEEIIFRGYIWKRLEKIKLKPMHVIIGTDFFFGLFHLAGYYEIQYATSFFREAPALQKILFNKVVFNTGYGLFLGYVRLKAKNLYPSLIIHSIGNIIGS